MIHKPEHAGQVDQMKDSDQPSLLFYRKKVERWGKSGQVDKQVVKKEKT